MGVASARNFREDDRLGVDDPASANYRVSGKFVSHSYASGVRANLGDALFDSYTKIAIHRDPADFLISQFFYRVSVSNTQLKFDVWFTQNARNVLENYRIAPISGPNRCDLIFDYANLETQIAECDLLPDNFASEFSQLAFKGQYRDDSSRDVSAFYKSHDLDPDVVRDLVQRVVYKKKRS